ncbi:MAG: hypothetical protein IPK22_28785 [Verrucomicrobiaceae bacterium]|nr:hypothetical protein [Verrucomicrobiaceae bacterium]
MGNDLKKQGVGLLVLDYPRNANENKIRSYVGQVQNYLVEELGVPMNMQAYSGYSLGGNPALVAANNNPEAAGLHLTATVSSIRQETKNKMKQAAPNASRVADKGEITTLMDNIAETRRLVEAQGERPTPMPVSIVYSNQDQFGREGNNHMTPLLEEFEHYPQQVVISVDEFQAATPEEAHENVLSGFANLEGIKNFAQTATAYSQGPQVAQHAQGQNAPGNDVNPPQVPIQPIQPDPEVLANAPNYPAPPPPAQNVPGNNANPPQAPNQPIQPDPEVLANAPNYPAPPPPAQEGPKQPKANIRAKEKDAGDGMPLAAEQAESQPIIAPQANESRRARQQSQPPPVSRGLLSPIQIDKAISDHFPHDKVSAELKEGHVTNYRNLAIDISHAVVNTNQADRQAIEARMIEQFEIAPLQEQIDKLEAEIELLENTPGIEAGDERIIAKREDLTALYEECDNWEVRVDALKKGMGEEDRKKRLGAINAELALEKQALEGVEKVNEVRFDEEADDLAQQRRNPRLLAASALAAGSMANNQTGNKPNNGDFTPSSVSQQIQNSYKGKYGAKYHPLSENKNRKDPIPDELKPIIAEMQPTIDKVNQIQKQIRDLDDARDRIILKHRDTFTADPSLIQDAALLQRVRNDQQSLQQAEKRIQHCDNQLAALEIPGSRQVNEAVRDHGSVEKARAHYEAEKKQAANQRSYSRSSLETGFMTAAQQATAQDPQAIAMLDQMAEHRQEQAKVLRQYQEEKIALVAGIMPDLFPDQEIEDKGNEVAVAHDVRSALKRPKLEGERQQSELRIAELDLRRKMGQTTLDVYDESVQMAVAKFKMEPQSIPDPEKRQQGVALKLKISELEAKAAYYDKEIARLEKGKIGARLRSLADGGAKARKELYAKKKVQVSDQIQKLGLQLDVLAENALSANAKRDLLNHAAAANESKAEMTKNAQQEGNIIIEEKKEAPAAHKPSVGEALHRSHSMPNLGGPQVAAHQPEGQQAKKGVGKDKSLRASGSWQMAKSSSAKATGIKT